MTARPETPVRLSPEREAEIAARHEAATSGPWEANARIGIVTNKVGDPLAVFGGGAQDRADAGFTAHARTDVPALLAELAAVRAERDAFRAQRNNVFATNERLLAQVDESGQARLRAENETRTVKREARDELAAFRALELGDLDGRVSASCAEPGHPTWLRAKDDTRGCPWCRVTELEVANAEAVGVSESLYRRLSDGMLAGSALYAALTMPTTPEQRQAALDKFKAVAHREEPVR